MLPIYIPKAKIVKIIPFLHPQKQNEQEKDT